MRSSTLLGLAVVALLIAAPLGLPVFAMTLLTELVILGLFAMSLDLMVGYTRLVSFGHVAAYGFGAYASGYMLLNSSMPLPLVAWRSSSTCASDTTIFGVCCRRFMFGSRSVPPAMTIASPGA